MLKDPLNAGIVNNVIPLSPPEQAGARLPGFHAAAEHAGGDAELLPARRRAPSPNRTTTTRASTTTSPPRIRSPDATFSTTPTKPASRSGATTNAITWAGPRTMPAPGPIPSGRRSSTNCAADGTSSSKRRFSARPTIPPTTSWEKWDCRWFPGCRRNTGRPRSRSTGRTARLPPTTCSGRSGRATVPTKSTSSSIRFPGSTASTS